MQIEQVSALERRVKISVPMSDVAKEVEARLKRLSRTVKMQGFRPGKVPMKLVAQNYGYQVQSDVMSEKINSAVNEAIEQSHLRVAGSPKIEAAERQDEAADNADFIAVFEVFPEVRFKQWDSIQVERFATSVTDAEIEKTIEILRKQRQTFEPVNRAAQDGDQVTLDFVGRLDGVEFDGGKAEGFQFTIGAKQMLPEFEQAAIGLAADEERTFSLTFPEDYHGKEVAGKTAEFTIKMKQVAVSKLPEVNAEFAQQLGIEGGDVDKMREDVRANLQREVDSRIKARTKDSVMNGMIEAAEFDVPKALVEQDIERLKELTQQDMKSRGLKADGRTLPNEIFASQAERRVRLGLVVNELVNQNGLKATPEQIRKHLEDFAKSYEDPASVLAWYYGDRKRLADVEAVVLEDNVVNWVLSNAKVTDKQVPFDELMGSNQ